MKDKNEDIIIVNGVIIAMPVVIAIGSFVYFPQFQTIINFGSDIVLTIIWGILLKILNGKVTNLRIAPHFKRGLILFTTSLLVHGVMNNMVGNYSLALIILALVLIGSLGAILSLKCAD